MTVRAQSLQASFCCNMWHLYSNIFLHACNQSLQKSKNKCSKLKIPLKKQKGRLKFFLFSNCFFSDSKCNKDCARTSGSNPECSDWPLAGLENFLVIKKFGLPLSNKKIKTLFESKLPFSFH